MPQVFPDRWSFLLGVEVHEPLDRAALHTLSAHERPGGLVEHEAQRNP